MLELGEVQISDCVAKETNRNLQHLDAEDAEDSEEEEMTKVKMTRRPAGTRPQAGGRLGPHS